MLIIPFRGKHGIKRSIAGVFAATFRVLRQEKYGRNKYINLYAALGLVPLRGEKHFKPRPQNWILVPLRGSFQNF